MENDIVDRLHDYMAKELENGPLSVAGRLCADVIKEIEALRKIIDDLEYESEQAALPL